MVAHLLAGWMSSARVSQAYDAFYIAWCRAVQGNAVEHALKATPPAGPTPSPH